VVGGGVERVCYESLYGTRGGRGGGGEGYVMTS